MNPRSVDRDGPFGSGGRDIEAGHTDRKILIARAYLSAVAEPPAPALATFVAEHGPVRAAELVLAGCVPALVGDEVNSRRDHVDGEANLTRGESIGARLVVPESEEWPHERFSCFSGASAVGMADMAEPLALWVRGRVLLVAALDAAVAIVGARAASGYGEQLAAEIGYGVAKAGFTVVSGAAYGIDGAAHRGALAAEGITVAFLACGLDIDYPAGHGRLLRTIAEQGAVVSEYPPGTSPRKHRFLVRNRLIAGAGQGTVVVEAGARSGAGNTATSTDALGRQVMAVPGPVTSATSVGCHEMVRSGKAVLVTNATEVIELIGPLRATVPHDAQIVPRRIDTLNEEAKRIYDALSTCDTASPEQLARDSGLPLRKVRAVLPMLEMAELVSRRDGGWARRTAEHARS